MKTDLQLLINDFANFGTVKFCLSKAWNYLKMYREFHKSPVANKTGHVRIMLQ
jgi:hypothetical protein